MEVYPALSRVRTLLNQSAGVECRTKGSCCQRTLLSGLNVSVIVNSYRYLYRVLPLSALGILTDARPVHYVHA